MAPAIETERDYFFLGVSSTTEVTENMEQAMKSVTGREMHVSVVEPLDVCFINSSPVELPYACTVEGDRRHVQNVGAGG
jgi:hypothetical protein